MVKDLKILHNYDDEEDDDYDELMMMTMVGLTMNQRCRCHRHCRHLDLGAQRRTCLCGG